MGGRASRTSTGAAFDGGRRRRAGQSDATARLLTELSDPFVVRLLQLLRDQEPAASEALEHLEAELAERGSDPNEVLRREHRRQAANQVTVGNCVLSLRLLSAVDWNAFFEQSSHVEAILREDPSGVYPRQDFATSDRYRRAVETIARGSSADEIEVARRAVDLARARHASAGEPRDHVGYLPDRPRPGRARRRPSAIGPAGASACSTGSWAMPECGLLRLDRARPRRSDRRSWSRWRSEGASARGGCILVAAVLLLPLSELAVGLVNHLLTLFLPPARPAQARLQGGDPDRARDVRRHPVDARAARQRGGAARAARDSTTWPTPTRNLRFALLTDFADAPQRDDARRTKA